jgi:transcriptional regulator with XRE-family HTH domain
MLTLIDLCRAAKEERHLTNKDIADGSGVPLGTVNNLFRSSTHSPTVETIGPICAFLDVSMDGFFGKTSPEPEDPTTHADSALELMEREVSSLHQEINGLNAQNELLRELVEKQNHGIRIRDHFMIHLLVLLIGVLVYAVCLDLHCLEFGFFHG